jgi:hypothetical protein
MLNRILPILSHVALFTTLVGCAGGPSISMSDSDRAAIKTVAIASEVQIKPEFSFQEKGAGMGAVFGVVGAVVEVMATQPATPLSNGNQILAMMKANNISVQEIVKAEFTRAATARGATKFTETSDSADATLSLTINLHGLGRTHLLGGQLHPVLNVSATMKNPSGSVIWQRTEFITPMNAENKKSAEFEEYMKNPELLRAAFTNAATIVTKWLADKLPGK